MSQVLKPQSAPTTPLPKALPASGGSRLSSALAWLRQVLPTPLIVLLLGGLALWGHHTGWKVPKFSALTGSTKTEDKDWCPEHGVPESQCVECNPALLPRGKTPPFCKKHGIPVCPLDYPEVAQVEGRPEFPKYDTKAALDLLERPENNSKCKFHERRLQFASAAAAEKAGVDVDVVQEAPMSEYVTANAEVSSRMARLSARVPGTVCRVYREVGQAVKEGDVLALVDAAEVGRAKSEFLQAFAQLGVRTRNADQMEPGTRSGSIPEPNYRAARAAEEEARIRLLGAQQALVNLGLPIQLDEVKGLSTDAVAERLRFLGLPDVIVKSLDAKRATGNLLPVVAPLDNGVVVAREVVEGEVVDNVRCLFVVADPRQVWLTLNVRQEEANHLAVGQPVRFRPDSETAEFAGQVASLSPVVDEKTRTLKVRAVLPNPDGRLRANTFGTGRIILREEKFAVVVPREAVQWEGDCFVVFVRDKNYLTEGAPKVFHVRKVRPGARDEKYTEILAGVLPGELVVSKGSGVLEAELLKSKLGDG